MFIFYFNLLPFIVPKRKLKMKLSSAKTTSPLTYKKSASCLTTFVFFKKMKPA